LLIAMVTEFASNGAIATIFLPVLAKLVCTAFFTFLLSLKHQ
jgi:hypothetical protein